jgi:N-formylglutamate amidohydrolase
VAKSPSPIKVGSRVRFIGKGSIRCGMIGTVKAIAGGIAKIWLDYHSSLAGDLRNLEAGFSHLELLE